MAIPIISKEVITKILASSNLFSEKLFPRKRCIPVGIPKLVIAAMIPANETRLALVPITSLVVIFDTTSQKI